MNKKNNLRILKNIYIVFIFFILFFLTFGMFSALENKTIKLNSDVSCNEFNFNIFDAEGKLVDAETKIFDKASSNYAMYISSENNLKEISVKPSGSMIKEIYFNNVILENDDFIKIDYPNIINYPQFLDIYAIDPNNFSFSDANVTAFGNGKNLMKCETWNFEERLCEPLCEYDRLKNDIRCQSGWEKIADINKQYSFILTPQDPAFATYESSFGAPYCDTYESPCIANSSQIQCAGNQASPGPELNSPNTIDSCLDAERTGTCHSDESVENITIETLNGSIFNAGDFVQVNVTWYCYYSDRVAIYYTNSTSSIKWELKTSGSDICPESGFYSARVIFKLDNVSGNHSIRGIIRYNNDIDDPCPGLQSSYSDQDDLVFNVAPPNTAPEISLNFPSDLYTFNDISSVKLNFTISDDFNSSINCSVYFDSVLNSTNSSVLNNTLTNFLIEGVSHGKHNWSVNCSDGFLSSVSEVREFWVNDFNSPKWSSVSKNKSFINFGDLIKFNTSWVDNLKLSGFIFSSNDSGSWINSTFKNFNGVSNVSKYILEVNSSVGEIVGWYFWANDSYGNSNETKIQIFTVENISTALDFNLDNIIYLQGESLYNGYRKYIYFDARFVDNMNNSISDAYCVVSNDKTSDLVILDYNQSTGNYTGRINNYNIYGNVTFNASCSKDNYATADDSDFANVVAYGYLWELDNLSYSSNSTSSKWIRRKPAEGASVYTLSQNFSLSSGENLIYEFPVLGLGKNYSFLRDYNILGEKKLRLNISINDSSCKPFLGFRVRDFDLNNVYYMDTNSTYIASNTPIVVEGNFSDNITIQQGDYVFLELYLNCSSSVEEKVDIYYNYSGEPVNLEIPELILSEIVGEIITIYDDLPAPIVGPNSTLNVTEFLNFSLNNTGDEDQYIEYFLTLPIDFEYSNSVIPNTVYIYNSTGQLLASDNDSAQASNEAFVSSDNVVSWYTEVIPAGTAVVETGNAVIKDLIRNEEKFMSDLNGEVKWNVTVFSISSLNFGNLTIWTNYSSYGVDDSNYDFNITREKSGVVTDLTNNVTVDNSTKKISFPTTSVNNVDTYYYVTASDSSSPEVHLVSPLDNISVSESSQNLSCNISDISIDSLSFYLWNSISLVYNETVSLSGENNETNFSYSFSSDGSYEWNCLGNDSQGNSAFSQEGNYTINYDSTPPNIEIISPENITYNNTIQVLNISSDGESIWYNWNGTNYTYSSPLNVTFNQGVNNLFVYSNDSLGNLNYTSVIFEIVDNISPTFSLIFKNDSKITFGETIKFNSTWDDNVELFSFIFSTNNSGSWKNSSFQEFNGKNNVSEYNLKINSSAGEVVGWYFWANDSYGNFNSTEIQTFIVENISTNLIFNINGTLFPQADPLYQDCKICIPFEVEYLDNFNNSIIEANCSVLNDLTKDVVYLEYNETTQNYTGKINSYNFYDKVVFNVTCYKENYDNAKANESIDIITYFYLWKLENLTYNSNLTSSNWLKRRKPDSSEVYILDKNFSFNVGENLVYEFPFLGLGKNYSFLNSYNALGNKLLRLNISSNNSSCNPFLSLKIKDFNLNLTYSKKGFENVISIDTPTVVESNFSENFTVEQGDYVFLELYMNCSAAANSNIKVYYNYSNQPVNFEIDSLIPNLITGQIIEVYDNLDAPIIGPNETLNVTENLNFLLNNTDSQERYIEYFLPLPINSEYTNSVIENTTYIYNSTGQLLASDNDSARAPNKAFISSNNVISWYTEIIPGNTTVVETGTSIIKDLIRNHEQFVSNSKSKVEWNISVFSISSLDFTNLTVWTNYSIYGVDDLNYSFNIIKEVNGEKEDITNEVILDNLSKKIILPVVNVSDIEVNYYVKAYDVISPETHLISPINNFSTSGSFNIFNCNISDRYIERLDFYLWNSTSLIFNDTKNLTGETNETNFNYSFFTDGEYLWNCLGVDSQNNSEYSKEGNYSIIYDSTPPKILINSPLNATYLNRTQLINVTSDGLNIWYNWNGSNLSYFNPTLIKFHRGPNSLFFYSNDSLGNLNITTLNFYINSTPPIINEALVSSFAIVNGSNITFGLNSSYDEYAWINITIPGSGVEKIFFDEKNLLNFSDSSVIGRYAVNFYVNDSFGLGDSYQEYFESFSPRNFNFTLRNSENENLNSTFEIIYRNKTTINSSGEGTYSSIIPNIIADFKVKSYLNKIQVLFPNFNFSSESGKVFYIDKTVTPSLEFLTIYGINNSYNFSSATLRIYYDDLSFLYSDESNLELYKCNNYNFTSGECLVNWINITSSSIQNLDFDYFEYTTNSFSAFSIKEVISEVVSSSSRGGGATWAEKDEFIGFNETFQKILNNFYINIEIKDNKIYNLKNLLLLINYKTFNNDNFTFNILFEIFDSFDKLVYSERGDFFAHEEGIYNKNFSDLNFGEGNYKIRSSVFFDSKQIVSFVNEFEFIKSKSITGHIVKFSNIKSYLFFFISLIIILIIFFISVKKNREHKRKLKRCKKEKRKKKKIEKYRKIYPVKGRVMDILKENKIDNERRYLK